MLFAKARKIKKLTTRVKELEKKVKLLENENARLEDHIKRDAKRIQRLTDGINKCSPFIEPELFFNILTDAVNVAYD